ncbi:MAG: hypothetical protein NTZ55_01725 [Candidatus Roizmanbacteria bacterium]|nr:hypothetical protein [Candidatus Roizmanbacteria bacterium]
MDQKTESHPVRKFLNTVYWVNLPVALLGIVHDLTGQELIREQQAQNALQLTQSAQFLNNNFVGDIGNAFACVFGVPAVMEIVNSEIQKSDISEPAKGMSEFITNIAPFAIAALFIAGAIDGETAQHVVKWGTPDKLDLIGAAYGTAVALPSILKFRNAVFPRN